MRESAALQAAVSADRVPTGAWAVGVSGGADSVALLHLLASRDDLRLVVAHLNHELRGEESDEDERFVRELVTSLKLPVASQRISELKPDGLPKNPSALYRRLRFSLFADVLRLHQLHGVILAHHADDQAETVFQRLVRGSSYVGLCGMSPNTKVRGVRVLRPLLDVRSVRLRDYLNERGLTWREDSSNRSDTYFRNRVRALLRQHEELHEPLVELAHRCRALRDWVRGTAPSIDDAFTMPQLADLPRIVARETASRWLRRQGVPSEQIGPEVVQRLLTMCEDASSSSRVQFPGGITVRRRAGKIMAESRAAK
jgi:tRNA(Ile)-lysidine synthase